MQLTERNSRNFELRVSLPIQILTCKVDDASTTLPKYSEYPLNDLTGHGPWEASRKSITCQCLRKAADGPEDKAREKVDVAPPAYESLIETVPAPP